MPKNENENENIDNVETPAEYTPPAAEDNAEAENVTPIEDAPAKKRRLGTAAIVGISAAGVALMAGMFGTGYAVANANEGDHRPPMGAQLNGDAPMLGDGDMDEHMDDDGDAGRPPHGPKGGHMGGDKDGSMPGNVPHEHDENGQDIVPEDAEATPAPTS